MLVLFYEIVAAELQYYVYVTLLLLRKWLYGSSLSKSLV